MPYTNTNLKAYVDVKMSWQKLTHAVVVQRNKPLVDNIYYCSIIALFKDIKSEQDNVIKKLPQWVITGEVFVCSKSVAILRIMKHNLGKTFVI